MGFTWGADTPYPLLALQLALLGAGFGLTTAPTTSAVVDHAAPEHRGSAAAVVMVVRLLGLSVGLSALTAWGLARFNALRGDIELPPLTDPGFESALREVSADLTSTSIAETFLATAALLLVGFAITALMLRRAAAPLSTPLSTPLSKPPPTPSSLTKAPMTNDDTPRDDPSTTESPTLDEPRPGTASETAPGAHGWQRHLGKIVGAFALLLLAGFAMIAVLFIQLQSTQDDLNEAIASLQTSTDDIARVEAGAALYASQVTGFQEQIIELQPTIQAGLDDAVEGLQTFSESTLEFTVSIDESIDINTNVVIARTVEVPIKTTLPINEEFDTTIIIDGPFGTEIPLNITVPINLDVPIDITVDIPLDETIPINASVPVKVDVPIGVNVGDTQLADLAESLATGLESFTQILNGLGS
jgi:prefoldin subunit 5